MRLINNVCLYAAVFSLFFSCKDIVEHDISDQKINVITPLDNYKSSNYSVNFWWDEIDGAQRYRIQVVSPTFNNLQKLIVDTSTTDLKIILTLFPGNYQWRIRGENGSSQTLYITRNISIDTNTDLTGQIFFVSSPANNYYSNSGSVLFSWNVFPFATSYEYVLMDTTYLVLKTKAVTENTINDTLSDGEYYWKIRAYNSANNTYSDYSTVRALYVDLSAPSASVPLLPANLASVTNPIQLTWSRPPDVVADSIYLASDSSFQTITSSFFVTTNASLNLSPQTVGNIYYWRIKSKDKAGNWSPFCPFYRFTVTP